MLNALCGENRAIVTEVEGTTRDVVEGKTVIGGVKFNLFDTAGIRQTDDKVEKIGIGRSIDMINGADIVIFVADASKKLTPDEEDIYNRVKDKNLIVVANKSDLIDSAKNVEITAESGKTTIVPDVVLSCKNEENIDKLKQILREKGASGVDVNGEYITEKRHYIAICEADEALSSAIGSIGAYPLDLVSCDIKTAWEKLGEITGTTASEDVIDKIFEKFCVGK